MLDERDRQYFDSLEETFQTQGWDNIVSDAEARVDQIKEDLATKNLSNEETWHLRGQVAALRELIHSEQIMRANREATEDEENESDSV